MFGIFSWQMILECKLINKSVIQLTLILSTMTNMLSNLQPHNQLLLSIHILITNYKERKLVDSWQMLKRWDTNYEMSKVE